MYKFYPNKIRYKLFFCLFFVKNEYQGLGVGKTLFQMMYNYCVEELRVKASVNKSIMDLLAKNNCFGDLPESDQMSMF